MLFNSPYIALNSFLKQKIYQNDFLRPLKTYSDNMSFLAAGMFKFEQKEIFPINYAKGYSRYFLLLFNATKRGVIK